MFNLPQRAPQTYEEFVAELCLKNNVTPEQIHEALDITPCSCGAVVCTGWMAYPKGMQ